MRHDSSRWVFCACAALAVWLGRAIPAVCHEGLPQIHNVDLLMQVLGETRFAVSQMLVNKADEYFHGGAKHIDCDHGITSCGHAQHDPHHDQEAHHDYNGDATRPLSERVIDPWRWINQRVHMQEHRHLKGVKNSEILPWLWAASRLSAENLQAFESSAYVLTRMLGKPDEAVRLLEEGIARNPGSAELEFSLGELWLHEFHDEGKAVAAFASARAKNARMLSDEDDDKRILQLRTLFYLGYLSARQEDLITARQYLHEAEELSPNHVFTHDLRKVIQGQEH